MPDTPNPEFDAYAANYDAALNRGLALSGESKEFFADGRARWLRKVLPSLQPGARGLDFGCGVGAGTPYLLEHLQLAALTGADVSDESLRLAKAEHGSEKASFIAVDQLPALHGSHDIAYCNGVFHHIPLEDRAASARSVFDSLRPGGHFAFWENSRWNPMVHFIMSRVPFDADAQMLFPHQARQLLRAAGFEIVRTDYLFVFPGPLAALRVLEPALCKLPLGGQYQILCRKPLVQ
jgi:SAM-dependent methyltransferase